jgi:hypothetical protein
MFREWEHQLYGNHFHQCGDLAKISEVKKLGPRGAVYFHVIIAWVCSWSQLIVTYEQYKHSHLLLEFWLSMTNDAMAHGLLMCSIAQQVKNILIKFFNPHEMYYL